MTPSQRRLSLLAAIASAAIAGACQRAEPPAVAAPRATAGGHDAARQALLAADGALAASIEQRGEADGLWPAFADDGVYLHPGADLVAGRDAVRDFVGGALGDRSVIQHLHRIAADASDDGTIGYSVGWFDETGRAGGGPRFGKYLAAWRTQAGAWRLAAFVRIAAPKQPSPPPADAAIVAGDHGVPRPGAPDAMRAEVLDADTAFAATSAARGYTIAFTTACAPDAVIVGGGDFHWNAAGVAEALAGWTPDESLTWTPRLGGAAASGDLGYTVGTAVHRNARATPDRTYSKYLTVWARQADGRWRFLLDGGNPRPASP